MRKLSGYIVLLFLGLFALTTFPLTAGQHPAMRTVTAEDYAHAEKFLSKFMSPLAP